MRLPSNAAAVALSRRSQAARRVSIAHVGSDQGIGRPQCPLGDRGAAGVLTRRTTEHSGHHDHDGRAHPHELTAATTKAKDARQRFEALPLRKHPVVGVGSSTRTLLMPR